MKCKRYAWVDFFSELAAKINDNPSPKSYLLEKARGINWMSDNPPLLRYGNDTVDPFSFFYALAQKQTKNQCAIVYGSVRAKFDLKAEFPPGGQIMPTPPANVRALFHNGEQFSPDLLWRVFSSAVSDGKIDESEFERVLDLPNVDVNKFTQTLFLINPRCFLPIGATTKDFADNDRKARIKGNGGYTIYGSITREVRETFPNCELYEINYFLYCRESLIQADSRFSYYQISSNVNGQGQGQADYWKNDNEPDFNNHSCIFTGGSYDELDKVIRGDIVLARTGYTGRAIGVVIENGYSKGWSEEKSIDVVWINKSEVKLDSIHAVGFSKAGPGYATYESFRRANEYEKTFRFIEGLSQQDNGAPVAPRQLDMPVPAQQSLNVIFCGPPGTGKTFKTAERCVAICEGLNAETGLPADEIRKRYKSLVEQNQVRFITFHQTYSYEEFVEGLRPKTSESAGFHLEPKNGILKEIANDAEKKTSEPYVLVIDEINRANVSKVFGELITLLEEDKRAGGDNEVLLQLPYSMDMFSLPPNLYVLGTMNTADRSIALLDTALRRRFEFEEILPDPDLHLLKTAANQTNVDLPDILRKINQRLEYLKDRDHLIGHAWLMKAKNRDELDRIMRSKIIPLIAEYFHDDWNSVRAVLGNNDSFVQRTELQTPRGIDGNYEDHRYSWEVLEEFPDDAYDQLIAD